MYFFFDPAKVGLIEFNTEQGTNVSSIRRNENSLIILRVARQAAVELNPNMGWVVFFSGIIILSGILFYFNKYSK